MALVLGLGNPGPRNARTRHNAGWLLLERLVRRWDAEPAAGHATWRAWRTARAGVSVDLLMPLTYMNASGEALAEWRDRHGLEPAAMLVVVDDVHLPVGLLRLRGSGSSGGHRGLESLEQVAGREFARLRIGVGEAADGAGLREHVLDEFAKEEETVVDAALEQAADAVDCWLAEGLPAAMNRFNRRIRREEPEP